MSASDPPEQPEREESLDPIPPGPKSEGAPTSEVPAPPSEPDPAPETPTRRLPRAASPGLFLLLALASSFYLFLVRPEGRDKGFEIDEAEWLTMSVHNARQITEGLSPWAGIEEQRPVDEAGDVPADANPWMTGIHQATFGFMNPMLAKVGFGSLCLALGHRDYDPAVYPKFSKRNKPAQLYARRAVLPVRDPVRRVITITTGLVAAGVFFLARRTLGLAAGFTALAIFLLSPGIQDAATRIRTDLFPIACAVLGCLVATALAPQLAGERGRSRLILAAATLGLFAGLSVGTKFNGALLAFMVGAWILVAWLAGDRERRASFLGGPLLGWIVAGAITLVLFVASVPALWPAPLENLDQIMRSWDGDLSYQKRQYGERLGQANTPAEHAALAWRGTMGRMDWGRGEEPFRALFDLPVGPWMLAAGLIALLAASVRAGREPDRASAGASLGAARAAPWILAVYLVFQTVGQTLWLPFGRRSFYLPYLPVMAILEGLAVGGLVYLAVRAVRRRSKEKPA